MWATVSDLVLTRCASILRNMTTLMIVDGQRGDETRSQVIARRLRGELAQMGLSISKAASMCGYKQQWFSRRMTGAVPFDVEDLDGICTQLGLSFDYILTGIRALPGGPGEGITQSPDLVNAA